MTKILQLNPAQTISLGPQEQNWIQFNWVNCPEFQTAAMSETPVKFWEFKLNDFYSGKGLSVLFGWGQKLDINVKVLVKNTNIPKGLFGIVQTFNDEKVIIGAEKSVGSVVLYY